MTLWLSLPLEDSLLRRMDQVNDRIEAAGSAFLQRVCDGFASLAARRNWSRIDASRAPALVTAAIQERLKLALMDPC